MRPVSVGPFACTDGGDQYTKAMSGGLCSSNNSAYKETYAGKEYSVASNLSVGNLPAERNTALYLEQVNQRADGTFYAIGPGQMIDT